MTGGTILARFRSCRRTTIPQMQPGARSQRIIGVVQRDVTPDLFGLVLP